MPTNKDKLSLNIFICIYIYRIDPVIAIVFSIILWSSFLTGAKLLCKLSPPTCLCLRIKSFFFLYSCMLHVHATQKRKIRRQELRDAVFKVRREARPNKRSPIKLNPF